MSLLNFSQRTSPGMSMRLFFRSFRCLLLKIIPGISMIFYQSFLLRQELISRGDFVDVDNLECTPKIGKYTVKWQRQHVCFLDLPWKERTKTILSMVRDVVLIILFRWKTRCSATSITCVRPTGSWCRNFARFEICSICVGAIAPFSGRPCVRHPWKVLQPPTKVWIHDQLSLHIIFALQFVPLNRSNLTAVKF